MRDCVFLVADKSIGEMLKAFLTRPGFHLSLGCAHFSVTDEDFVVASGLNDPGVYTKADTLLKPYANTHRHAMVILDEEWDGSPGAPAIVSKIDAHLSSVGWGSNFSRTIVIEPEIENWVWIDSPNVCSALGFSGTFQQLRSLLHSENLWDNGKGKPSKPKEALNTVLKRNKVPFSSSIFKSIAARSSVQGCVDPSFQTFKATLISWFPPVYEAC